MSRRFFWTMLPYSRILRTSCVNACLEVTPQLFSWTEVWVDFESPKPCSWWHLFVNVCHERPKNHLPRFIQITNMQTENDHNISDYHGPHDYWMNYMFCSGVFFLGGVMVPTIMKSALQLVLLQQHYHLVAETVQNKEAPLVPITDGGCAMCLTNL